MPNIPPRLALLPSPVQPTTRPMFRTLGIAASGLSAQRQRMETIANNVANAETTRDADGQPYQRRVTRLEAATPETQMFGAPVNGQLPGAVPLRPPFGAAPFEVPSYRTDDPRRIEVPVLGAPGQLGDGMHGVRVGAVEQDATEGPLVYDPGHPDADANGYVRYPNVRVTDELIDLMDARRIYEANATVFQSAKQMLRKALDI